MKKKQETIRYKMIPRDISQSLGKLPPAAVDMEENVLGAIMLEKNALDAVMVFLKTDHFYKEAHQEIFAAIADLYHSKQPVDFRTVIYALRKSQKIELVGGAPTIIELTKGTSGANTEVHARVIVEMAVKRFAIQAASQIHQNGYEDSTDAFELLDSSIIALQTIRDSTVAESGKSRIEAMWLNTLITEKPDDDRVLIRINGVDVCTANNHSLLIGKKKTRKTLFTAWMISQGILQGLIDPTELALFDTEQGKSHVWRLQQKIKKLTGHDLPIFYLRGMAPIDRREFIALTVKYWKHKLALIVVDGIRDLMSNINDPDEATEVIVWLEKLTLEHNLHVMDILHMNKTDDSARGHIGTELLNKAQITFSLSKNPADGALGPTIVECESSRDVPFEKFAFTHGLDGLPEIVGVPIQGNIIPEDDMRNRLINAFDGQLMRYTELTQAIKDHFSDPNAGRQISKNKCETMLQKWVRDGWIVKTGKPRDPKSMYKLMITETGQFVPLETAKAKQESLFEQNGHDSGTATAPQATEKVKKAKKSQKEEAFDAIVPPEIQEPEPMEESPTVDLGDGTDDNGNFSLF